VQRNTNATNNLGGTDFNVNSGFSISGAGSFTVSAGTVNMSGFGRWQPGFATISEGVLEGTESIQDRGSSAFARRTTSTADVPYVRGGIVNESRVISGVPSGRAIMHPHLCKLTLIENHHEAPL
jgi:hypothetical protein